MFITSLSKLLALCARRAGKVAAALLPVVLCAGLIVPAAGGGIAQAADSKLRWFTDLQSSMRHARSGRKYILIDFYTDWCGWCKKLDRETYANPAVVTYLNSSFVCLKLNAEDNGEGQSMAQQYSVNGFPCTMVLNPAGQKIGEFYGYRDPGNFLQEVNKVVRGGR